MVSGSDDPSKPVAKPTLVLGMAPLRKPGTRIGQSAVRALADIAQRGLPAHLLAGDRAYTQCKPEDFQLPARSLGYQMVLDYEIDQLGLQGTHQGMIQVDGSFYCSAMSEPLMNATRDFLDGKIDEATHRARIAERRHFAIRAKSQPDADGHLRVMCPAAAPAPQVRCQLKPASEGGNGKVRTRIPVTDVLAALPPKICTQGSITLPPDAGAKFRQRFAHESDEWRRTYATLRNSNEGMNGYRAKTVPGRPSTTRSAAASGVSPPRASWCPSSSLPPTSASSTSSWPEGPPARRSSASSGPGGGPGRSLRGPRRRRRW